MSIKYATFFKVTQLFKENNIQRSEVRTFIWVHTLSMYVNPFGRHKHIKYGFRYSAILEKPVTGFFLGLS